MCVSLAVWFSFWCYNCTRKEMRWRSGVGARRRKSGATLAFPDASTCFRTIAASVPSQRAQWPRSHMVPSLSSAGRAASEPIVVHVKESPEFALYSSRFSHWFSSSLRPQRGVGVGGHRQTESHHSFDRHAVVSSEALLWHTYLCCSFASRLTEIPTDCSVSLFRLWASFWSDIFSLVGNDATLAAVVTDLRITRTVITGVLPLPEGSMFLHICCHGSFPLFYHWPLFIHTSFTPLDAEYLGLSFSQQKTIFSYSFLTIAEAQFWKQSSYFTKYYTRLAQLHTQYAEGLRFCAQWNTCQNYIQYTFIKTTSCHHRKHTLLNIYGHLKQLGAILPQWLDYSNEAHREITNIQHAKSKHHTRSTLPWTLLWQILHDMINYGCTSFNCQMRSASSRMFSSCFRSRTGLGKVPPTCPPQILPLTLTLTLTLLPLTSSILIKSKWTHVLDFHSAQTWLVCLQ